MAHYLMKPYSQNLFTFDHNHTTRHEITIGYNNEPHLQQYTAE